jgi:hypothetical protein
MSKKEIANVVAAALQAAGVQTTIGPDGAPIPVPVAGFGPVAQKPASKDAGYRNAVAFVHKAIKALRAKEGGAYKGVHAVYSGFNRAIGAKLNIEPKQVQALTRLMVERGDLETRPAKGGPLFYLPGELSKGKGKDDAAALLALIDGFKG